MKIKICGIQSIEAAEWAADAGVDMIGFVFAPSRRKVDIGAARAIADAVRGRVKTVGVFVNAPADEVEHVHQAVGLDYVQLHGDESEDYVKTLDIPVIKAFSVGQMRIEEMFRYEADHILIDSPPGKYRGGTGHAFDWSALDDPALDRSRLIMAGGINSSNIRAAYDSVRPAGVDISSGAETDGMKDENKIHELMEQMKGVDGNGTDLYTAE
ncbi:phosphoribosylanthranilate isomerase [Salinicoccus sp. ID82-1]|uniref:N-(5'-phosphoribosyl)anthranilate isomerase n=1 Tax=Salinicoccus cyprini TaxID=2493691 RepID=A0A558AWX6_9STAP|nr:MULTISPECIES: phosphoribosylanthranilate isomerase [Salinicoccus]MCG1010072.1 phosphoribosylanthranilate isomerase [Salinicoccus sp. ID82-1]TVT28764.1 phosphoribosylanthranilate isomerase [Salinicoccus cyprini]